MTENKIKLSRLKNLAIRLQNSVENKIDMYKNDLTEDLMREIKIMVDRGEIIIIQVNGKMRLGKSTVAFSIGEYIFNLLKEYKYRDKNEEFGIENIARDQHEKLIYMLKPENKRNVLVTDEYNEMEDSGLNSTANDKLLKDMSNIQAGRYIYGVNVSPTGIIDDNTDIVLNVIERRDEEKLCVCELKYRDYMEGSWTEILIGIVKIPVGHIINKWDSKVKDIFNKSNWNENDKKIISKYVKSDWYTKYVIRKYEKMDIVNKEGVLRPRELQWVELQWEIIEKYKKFTKFVKLSSGSSIKAMLKPFLNKKKIPVSILGIKELDEDIRGCLKLYEDYYKAIESLDKMNKKKRKSKNNEELEEIVYKINDLNEFINMQRELIKENEEHFIKKIELKKRYEGVDKKWN